MDINRDEFMEVATYGKVLEVRNWYTGEVYFQGVKMINLGNVLGLSETQTLDMLDALSIDGEYEACISSNESNPRLGHFVTHRVIHQTHIHVYFRNGSIHVEWKYSTIYPEGGRYTSPEYERDVYNLL